MNKKYKTLLFSAYLFMVIMLTKMFCMIDARLSHPINVIDIDSTSVITETEEPE